MHVAYPTWLHPGGIHEAVEVQKLFYQLLASGVHHTVQDRVLGRRRQLQRRTKSEN